MTLMGIVVGQFLARFIVLHERAEWHSSIVQFLAFLTVVCAISFIFFCLSRKNEAICLRVDHLEYINCLGRVSKQIAYANISSFRLDHYRDAFEYYAIVSDRQTIRISASSPALRPLALELRKRCLGEDVDYPYARFADPGQSLEEIIEW